MKRTIGLALSGGGSRAVAFHLGCLRALNDLGILDQVKILSTVSGGSVIGGLYAMNSASFPEFEKRVREMLADGLMWPTVKMAFSSSEGPKALLCATMTGSINLVLLLVSWIVWVLSFAMPPERRGKLQIAGWRPIRRFASRTTILRRAMDQKLFNGARLRDLKGKTPLLIINAAEMRTGSAFYFSANESGSWRLGRLARPDIPLAYAVTASAAFPMFLPAFDEVLPFDRRDGSRRVERVSLSDGGVYDNLGLAPLWPDREPSISLNVDPVDTIICCRAGYGLRHDPPNQFLLARLKSAFASIHDRAQNAATKRLFDLKSHGKLRTVVMPYLGQDDSRLKFAPTGLVTREEAYAYPTDFSAMQPEWIERLSRRGEQLTTALIAEHAPHLLKS
ncbi:patatin-like phospholipase family protein (plasmid) [Bradyrhizobium sp. 26S5]|uniref:patatin-like phospholipase family protein n=1 Tax=Bradyrhizobium sp. 26S5 TaxID=3139729 RepID=UPI0030CE03A4